MQYFCSATPVPAAATAVSELLQRYHGSPILLLLSGGSWLPVLDEVATSWLGPHCTISMLDERVSPDPQVNNFAQLVTRSFYHQAQMQQCQFIDTRMSPGESVSAVHDRWSLDLQAWHQHYPDGVVIATIGIGNDGHIAGIFPGTTSVISRSAVWTYSDEIAATVHPFTTRMTVSEEYIREKVTHAVVYAVGPEKKAVLASLTLPESAGAVWPANILLCMPSVKVYSDQLC